MQKESITTGSRWEGNYMAYVFYNPNPYGKIVGDCVVRALTKALETDWETAYMDVAMKGFVMGDMPSSNAVWGTLLKEHGFKKKMINPNEHENYTVAQFCEDHPNGMCVLATGTHVVAVENGTYYDAGDSGNEIPIYYWIKGN